MGRMEARGGGGASRFIDDGNWGIGINSKVRREAQVSECRKWKTGGG